MSSRTVLVFPGQGSQYVGMGKSLTENFRLARDTFEEGSDALGLSLARLCFEGPDSNLKLTANTQPAILAHSVALQRVLETESTLRADLYLGHSLGEYSALVAAKRLKFPDALRLVRQRGLAMQEAVKPGKGVMAAILNVDMNQLESWCLEASSPSASVGIANYNSPAQLVVSGELSAFEKLKARLEAQKIRFVILPVSAPFHCPMMEAAKEAMVEPLSKVPFEQNDSWFIPNLDAKATQQYTAEKLSEQITAPVLWLQSMRTAEELVGAEALYLEVGPGKVLSGLGKRCLRAPARWLQADDWSSTLRALN